MNASFLRLSLAALLLAPAGQAGAAETSSFPSPATSISVECSDRALPSQREVGELLGQHNFGQVYASRTRLMAEVGRACQRRGVARVKLVPAPSADGRAVGRSVAHQRSQ